MNCTCSDGRHNFATAVWHRAYCAWYDHRATGHRARAAVFGFVADRLCRFA